MRASAAVKQEPTPSDLPVRASAAKSEFIWPVPPEELARVVFDNKDPERKVSAHSAEEMDQSESSDRRRDRANEGRQQSGGCRRCCWSPVSSTYLGVRAVHDWRRAR